MLRDAVKSKLIVFGDEKLFSSVFMWGLGLGCLSENHLPTCSTCLFPPEQENVKKTAP
jgi:hypothetical protein